MPMNSYFIELPSGRFLNLDTIILIGMETIVSDNPSLSLPLEDVSYLRSFLKRSDNFIAFNEHI